MGRYSVGPGDGFEFLGLVEPAQPSVAAPGTAPLTRREARERESGAVPTPAAQPTSVRPTSGAELLFPEYLAQRQPTPEAPQPVRRTVVVVPAPTRRAKAKRPRGRAGVSRELSRSPRRSHASSRVGSLVALLFAGAILVGMSVPANAFMSGASPLASVTGVVDAGVAQGVDVSASAAPTTISRDGFAVISYQDLMVASYGVRAGTFTPTTGSIRWPFPYSVPISDGWGPRVAPCNGCSTFHQGVDFTPGTGTPIYAIADGVVEEHSGDSDFESFGNHVIIQHNIPGQNVESLYAHMITGSSTLQPGDHIKVGDFIGLVGETGSAVGAHLHFEIHIDKVPVDPFAWLLANTTNVP